MIYNVSPFSFVFVLSRELSRGHLSRSYRAFYFVKNSGDRRLDFSSFNAYSVKWIIACVGVAWKILLSIQ